jgi:mannose-6-phosphate isomerase-like protein (cupin superfamily)
VHDVRAADRRPAHEPGRRALRGPPARRCRASFYDTTWAPGRGPSLHRHPYAEVFLVEVGEATFTAGDEELVVTAGHVVVVPAETPHRFVNSGDAVLRVLSLHPNGEVLQTAVG